MCGSESPRGDPREHLWHSTDPQTHQASFSSLSAKSDWVTRPLPVCLVVGLGLEGLKGPKSRNLWLRMVERPAQRGRGSAESSEYKNGNILYKLKHFWCPMNSTCLRRHRAGRNDARGAQIAECVVQNRREETRGSSSGTAQTPRLIRHHFQVYLPSPIGWQYLYPGAPPTHGSE